MPGITTWAEPEKGVYLRENRTGISVKTGYFDPSLPGTENRMRPLAEGFRGLGVSAIERCAEADGEWVTIDEVGYLDSCCPEYCQAVRRLMGKKRAVIVVREQELPFLTELRNRQDVFCVNLDQPFGKTGCVIMASGLGTRFGSNKLLAEFQGKPLIEHCLEATEGIFERRVVVTRHQEIQELCRNREIPVIYHSLPYRSDTVRLGLEAVMKMESGSSGDEQQMEACLFCPADQPLLRRETVASLTLCAAGTKADTDCRYIWRVSSDGREGSPVLFPAWAYEELCSLPEGKGGGFVLRAHAEQVRLMNVQDSWELADADRPADLERMRRRGDD